METAEEAGEAEAAVDDSDKPLIKLIFEWFLGTAVGLFIVDKSRNPLILRFD